jgi:CheY-like chemotaxis protein
MEQGGTVQIEATNVDLGPDDVALMPSTHPGRYLKIMVKDHGTGIPPDLMTRIFDPYFTTKKQGSGLGLATAYSIVRKHEGHIGVTSTVGKGATFVVYLPASAGGAVPTREDEDREPIRGQGSILVMDDESVIRGVLTKALTGLGYEPTCVADGAEAIFVYEKALAAGRRFDAVILDLTVPGGMGGEVTIGRLREIDPAVRAIVSSGYSTGAALAYPEEHGFKGVVAKPYDMFELSRVLDQALR